MQSSRPITDKVVPGNIQSDADEAETGPLRCCAVTRARNERTRMLRFVVGPGHAIVPDLAAKLPGRGIWLSARRDVIDTACARGAFARAARMPVSVPPDLRTTLEDGLRRRIAELLGLARRAGQAVGGFDKAREWLAAGRAGLVVQAEDGSAEECARFLQAPRRDGVGGAWRGEVVRPLSAGALGAVFGRDRAVHVAVQPGRLALAVALETERLAGVCGWKSSGRAEA